MPDLPAEPRAVAPAPANTPAAQSFDQSFPDDGLDTPPAAPNPPAAPESGESPDKSTETATSKDATPAAEPTASKPSGSKEPTSSAPPAAPAGEKDFTPPTVVKSTELRNWATRMGSRAQKAESELSSLKARLTQLESQPPRQAENVTAMAQELAAAKKQLETYENNLRLTKYERSQEYETKFNRPYQDAVARAYREVKELLVTEPNPQNPEQPLERSAVQADFDEIYNLPLGPANKVAKAKFGDAASIVMQHRQNIRQLREAAFVAVEEYKTKGTEYETQTKAQQAQQEQAMLSMFTSASQYYSKSKPDLFLERDGDAEGNGLLAKGREFANTVFAGNDGLTPQQVVMRDAVAFNRLAGYPRLVRDVAKLKAELTATTQTIEKLRGSAPGPAKQGGPTPAGPSGAKDYLTEFDEKAPA